MEGLLIKRIIYKYVFRDLKKRGGLLVGNYDAAHGNEHFMFGVSLVMEVIEYLAGENGFAEEFLDNMEESEKKAGINRD